jgi:hypothetical protein
LHENYIRQCLENFSESDNVIQFASAEFTGPLPFVEFWLDTVGDWEREKDQDPFIALSCPKDVQDTILEDHDRSAIVDVIDFRYWWRTDKGEFSPPGGKNLAPRQFERRWRGGRPSDENLAQMASEYRGKFPTKAVLSNFETGAWAWVCAGGSMPRLPRMTDESLLNAIPRMKPWEEQSVDGCWMLREAGRQILVFTGKTKKFKLSGESGSFRVCEVNKVTGELRIGITIDANAAVELPSDQVFWLIREN